MKFSDLTWEDLQDWAGEKVVKRAKSYKRQVEDLRVTDDGALLAWVEGTDRYATLARMDANGTLSSQCTCPYSWGPCKHAVAVILAYIDAEQNNRKTPKADPDDERFDEFNEAGSDDDDMDDDDKEGGSLDVAPQETRKDEFVRKHLEGLSKNELVNLLFEGRNIIPELRQQLSDRAELQDGNVAKLITATRREIDKASREPAWTNHWRNESHIPDYSRVKQRLNNLLIAGQADAVLELGAYLMKKGISQIEQSNDEGETGTEIAECMDPVFKAVRRSSLSVPRRLLWEIDLRLKDEYSLLDGIKGVLDGTGRYAKEDWNQVAEEMAARLAKMPGRPARAGGEFPSKYEREQVMFWLLRALEQAGRNDEVIQILERETVHTDCYVELVKKLLASGQLERAREWARKGFEQTIEKLPGIAWRLEEQLREAAARENNAPLVAAYRALEFFDKPSVETYAQIEKAAAKANLWDAVRGAIMVFLETGRRPDLVVAEAEPQNTKPVRKDSLNKSEFSAWPLPSPQLPVKIRDSRWTRFPDTSTLVDIAIKEGRHDDALRWYRAGKRSDNFGSDYEGEKVAQAVQSTHPDEALAIWKGLVSREIAHAKPAAYQTAGGYLKKMRGVYEREKRKDELAAYLSELRLQNVRRPRLLDVLNALEGCRTPIREKGPIRTYAKKM